MILYLTIIFVATFLIALLNILLNPVVASYSKTWVIVATLLSVVIEIAIDGIFAGLVHSLPDKYFNPDKKIFAVKKQERVFYEKLKIRLWKDKVWDLGALGGFRKNKLLKPNSSDYIYKFLIEANIGQVVHVADMIVGFVVVLVLPYNFSLAIGLPVACVGLILNLMPLMVLRYNVPKLKVAYKRAKKMEMLNENN